MILVLLVVFLAICILGCFFDYETPIVIGGTGFFIALFISIWLTASVSAGTVIKDRIEMYSAENEVIQQQISQTVAQYQEYESGIIKEVAPESAITLIALYPNLKADVLVSKQIETYVSNNNIIRELKDNEIKMSVKRWWLYFGR